MTSRKTTLGVDAMATAVDSDLDDLEPGATPTAGPFTLIRPLGHGGMGTVWLAEDPRLGRGVAIKLLRPELARGGSTRLLEEGRALAQLSHPNVVTVFDTGLTPAGEVYVAMELVHGGSLAEWIAAHPVRTRPDFMRTLALLSAAGEGLAAAHRTGLVHRDFKPANVLVTTDGTPKVADFGLARGVLPSRDGTTGEPRDRDATIGVGTPAYMSPEQFSGRADERSDQFSFCVTAWEALYGARPFDGDSAASLLWSIVDGTLPPAPPASPVPATVRRALARGLAATSDDRWPSLDALLEALARTRTSAPAFVLFGATLALASLALIPLWSGTEASATSPACDPAAAQAEVAAVWNPERATAVAEAFRTTGAPYAEAASTSVRESFEDFGRRWAAIHVELCRSAVQDRSLLPEEHQLRLGCLRRQLAVADAALKTMERAGLDDVEHAARAGGELPSPSECRDEVLPTDAAETSVEAEAIRLELDEVRMLLLLGRARTVTERARALLPRADAVGVASLRGDALELLGRGLTMEGLEDEASVHLEEAYLIASSGDDVGRWRRRASILAWVHGERQDWDAARRWADVAWAAVDRPPQSAIDRSRLLHTRCAIDRQTGTLEDAERACRESVDVLRSLGTAQATNMALQTRQTLAGVLADRGRHDEAWSEARAAYQESVALFGHLHPKTAGMRLAMGRVSSNARDLPRAAEDYRAARDIFAIVYGEDHASTISATMNLGLVLAHSRDLQGAEVEYQHALAGLGDRRDAQYARVRTNFASLRNFQGRPAEALPMLREVADLEATFGDPDQLSAAVTHHALGLTLLRLRRLDEAEQELRLALGIRERAGAKLLVAQTHSTLSGVAEERGDTQAALEHYVAAREAIEAMDPFSPLRSDPLRREGNALARLGRIDEAVVCLRQAEQVVEPEFDATEQAWVELGWAFVHRQRHELEAMQARVDNARALVSTPSDVDADVVRAQLDAYFGPAP